MLSESSTDRALVTLIIQTNIEHDNLIMTHKNIFNFSLFLQWKIFSVMRGSDIFYTFTFLPNTPHILSEASKVP